jgi:hypothetical protein
MSAEIERQIKSYKLTFFQIRDEATEWRMSTPMFVDTYKYLLRALRRVPSQEEFIDEYFRLNKGVRTRALEARARRAYPSLVRETHLKALLIENGFDVIQDRNEDILNGVDLIINHGGEQVCIHSFVKTQRGKAARALKNKRHNFKGRHIDMELDLDEAKKVGDFGVYSQVDIIKFISQLWSPCTTVPFTILITKKKAFTFFSSILHIQTTA